MDHITMKIYFLASALIVSPCASAPIIPHTHSVSKDRLYLNESKTA